MLLLLLLKPKSPKWKFPTSNKRNRDSIAAINLIIMIPIGVGIYGVGYRLGLSALWGVGIYGVGYWLGLSACCVI